MGESGGGGLEGLLPLSQLLTGGDVAVTAHCRATILQDDKQKANADKPDQG